MQTVAVESTQSPLRPRTFAEYRKQFLTFGPSRAPLYADLRVPAVKAVIDAQMGSTWRTIPWNAPTSWNGWRQTPDGIDFPKAVTSSGGPAPYSRHAYADLPTDGKFRDAAWFIPAAIGNGIQTHSTFATKKVMTGYLRIIEAVTGVKL